METVLITRHPLQAIENFSYRNEKKPWKMSGQGFRPTLPRTDLEFLDSEETRAILSATREARIQYCIFLGCFATPLGTRLGALYHFRAAESKHLDAIGDLLTRFRHSSDAKILDRVSIRKADCNDSAAHFVY